MRAEDEQRPRETPEQISLARAACDPPGCLELSVTAKEVTVRRTSLTNPGGSGHGGWVDHQDAIERALKEQVAKTYGVGGAARTIEKKCSDCACVELWSKARDPVSGKGEEVAFEGRLKKVHVTKDGKVVKPDQAHEWVAEYRPTIVLDVSGKLGFCVRLDWDVL